MHSFLKRDNKNKLSNKFNNKENNQKCNKLQDQ